MKSQIFCLIESDQLATAKQREDGSDKSDLSDTDIDIMLYILSLPAFAEIEAELKQVQEEKKQQTEIRDSAGVLIWFCANTCVGGAEETKAASQKIEELNNWSAELNKKRLELKNSDPAAGIAKIIRPEKQDQRGKRPAAQGR